MLYFLDASLILFPFGPQLLKKVDSSLFLQRRPQIKNRLILVYLVQLDDALLLRGNELLVLPASGVSHLFRQKGRQFHLKTIFTLSCLEIASCCHPQQEVFESHVLHGSLPFGRLLYQIRQVSDPG